MFKSVDLQERFGKPIIRSLEIALTSKCNYHCPYCGAYKVKEINTPKLSVENIKEIIDSSSELERIILSGGEVTLLFDECLEVCRYCKEKGIEIQINTNATLLTKEKILLLAEAGLDIIHISLNFDNVEKYCTYYGVDKKLYYTLLENIRICAQNLDCVVETIVFSETLSMLDKLNKFIYDLGVRKHEIQYGIEQVEWNTALHSQEKTLEAILTLLENQKEDMHIYFSCFEIIKDGRAEALNAEKQDGKQYWQAMHMAIPNAKRLLGGLPPIPRNA